MNLEQLREQINHNYQQFFSTLSQRKELINSVSELKRKLGQESYDQQREKFVFSQFQDSLRHLTLKELLALSLIIEGQMGEMMSDYPKWSLAKHFPWQEDLNEEETLGLRVNPNMIEVFDERLFNKLSNK